MTITLRRRLILSHIIPLVVIIPIMGIALIYTLETRVLLSNLSKELEGQALLVAEVATDSPGIWRDDAQAQAFVDRLGPRLTGRMMLLSPNGYLLASSDPSDAERVGQLFESFDRADVLDGVVQVRTIYSRRLHTEVAQVLAPVMGPDQQVIGVVRLSRQLTTVYEWFLRLRYVIAGVLAVGLVLGIAVGGILALNMERPLRQVTQAIYRLSSGRRLETLTEQGPGEIRLLVHAFNALGERLHTLEQARRQLLANLVHELGRPLGALYSAIQALTGGADRDAALRQELLAGMGKEIKRLQRLLADLSRLHEQVLGTLELDREPVDLGGWLAEVLVPWREAAQRRGLQWDAAVPDDLPTMEIDPDRLAQALGNLLSNAIKYTPRGGNVSVESGVKDREAWIRVGDTGPGIAPDEQERVFTPFYRGPSAGRFPQGMGLGLTIARDLITAHNGRLEVESTPGQGSRFTIWIDLTFD
jgi:two-component system sensor histidine kinase BaeS